MTQILSRDRASKFFGAVHPGDLAAVADALNSRPRKTLGWRTPAEVLDEHLAAVAA